MPRHTSKLRPSDRPQVRAMQREADRQRRRMRRERNATKSTPPDHPLRSYPMNLYRIDLTDTQGRYHSSLTDLVGVRLLHGRSEANTAAIDAAKPDLRRPVLFAHIIRISGAGAMRRVGIVSPGSRTVGRVNDEHIPSLFTSRH